MDRYVRIFKEATKLTQTLIDFKNYDPIKDEDELNKDLLIHFGFKPDPFHEDIDGIICLFGKKGSENAVSIIGGNKKGYDNPSQINEKNVELLSEYLLYTDKNTKGYIITNCGVDLHGKHPFIKNIKVIKVPTSLK